MPTLTIAGTDTMASSSQGNSFWRHDRRMPSARRTEARHRAEVAARAATELAVERAVAPVVDPAGGGHDAMSG